MTQTVERNLELNGYILLHRAIERNLRMLEQHSKEQINPSQAKVKKISDWWNLVWDVVEQHHLMEDRIAFPTYFERDPGLRGQMDDLTADHHVLDDLVVQIEGFLKVAQQPSANRQAAYQQYIETLDKFNTLMMSHLGREETIVLRAEETLFTPEEVEALTQKIMKSTPMKVMAVEAPFIFTGADPAIEKKFMEIVPVFLKVIYKLAWRPKYLKRMAGYKAA